MPQRTHIKIFLLGDGEKWRALTALDLDYELGWQDAIELGRLGQKAGIRVEYRSHENIAVNSPAALVAGLSRPKASFRQRNLYCQFELSSLPASELESLEAKAAKLGDYISAGSLLRDVDAVWSESHRTGAPITTS